VLVLHGDCDSKINSMVNGMGQSSSTVTQFERRLVSRIKFLRTAHQLPTSDDGFTQMINLSNIEAMTHIMTRLLTIEKPHLGDFFDQLKQLFDSKLALIPIINALVTSSAFSLPAKICKKAPDIGQIAPRIHQALDTCLSLKDPKSSWYPGCQTVERFELESLLFYWLDYLLSLANKFASYLSILKIDWLAKSLESLQSLLVDIRIKHDELSLISNNTRPINKVCGVDEITDFSVHLVPRNLDTSLPHNWQEILRSSISSIRDQHKRQHIASVLCLGLTGFIVSSLAVNYGCRSFPVLADLIACCLISIASIHIFHVINTCTGDYDCSGLLINTLHSDAINKPLRCGLLSLLNDTTDPKLTLQKKQLILETLFYLSENVTPEHGAWYILMVNLVNQYTQLKSLVTVECDPIFGVNLQSSNPVRMFQKACVDELDKISNDESYSTDCAFITG
tara:strand:- start:1543 stop:2895 length:1353 start_codon:yes stop_codon:yes gene_type:complete